MEAAPANAARIIPLAVNRRRQRSDYARMAEMH
ncbi:hypothetical protein N183_28145 [Sinorhizobium sp. Sb3]|nr:hypothetical protein N183_28145 [Sinorhizobium sp. Sb3]